MAPTEIPPPLEGKKRRIGVMTSGGDAPGMNGAVRAVVRMAIHNNCEAFAIYEGYDGLVKGGDMIKEMHWEDVRGFLSEGGTLIGTARCMEFMQREGRRTAAKNMIIKGIDALIICGGDGSLTGADRFRDEWPSLLEELIQRKELTKEQAVDCVKECMKVLFYRDARSMPVYSIAVIDGSGVSLKEDEKLENQSWAFAEQIRGYGTQTV